MAGPEITKKKKSLCFEFKFSGMSHLIQGHKWGRTGDCFDMESPNPVFWLTPKHNCSSSCVAINVLFSCCTENVIYLTQTPGPLLCLLSKMALCLTEHMDRKSSSSFPLKLSKKGSFPIPSELSENTTAHNENTISSNLIRASVAKVRVTTLPRQTGKRNFALNKEQHILYYCLSL